MGCAGIRPLSIFVRDALCLFHMQSCSFKRVGGLILEVSFFTSVASDLHKSSNVSQATYCQPEIVPLYNLSDVIVTESIHAVLSWPLVS